VYEETGLRVKLKKLVGMYERVKARQGHHLVNFVFLVSRKGGGRIRTSDEHPDVRFVPVKEVEQMGRRGLLRSSTILAALRDWRRGQGVPIETLKVLPGMHRQSLAKNGYRFR
jgi:ADP-ribose pyrophosphatase YjhB (NUDIX family)